MTRSLLIAVRFHDGRYHGEEDGFQAADGWPPSPGRLFQALVAGAARGGAVAPDDQRALRWLEELQPPRIAAPPSRRGAAVPRFVPNNDLDAVGGDPRRVAEIRVGKAWRPHFFDARAPVLYVWDFDGPIPAAERVCAIAAKLYQLGRGVDMAAATAAILDCDEAQAALTAHPGAIRRPTGAGAVPVAQPGTLASLIERRRRGRERLALDATGRTLFTQPPKALFRHIGYDAPPRRLHFDLRRNGAFAPRRLGSAAALMTGLRDAAALRLQNALPSRAREIERLIVGRGAGPRDVVRRIRMTPIPSIGMEHTDPSIRRIMVEVPTECPIAWRDVEWAFAGLEPCDPATDEILPSRVVATNDAVMAGRYMRHARVFRTVTPAALSSVLRPRRRTQPDTVTDAARRGHDEAQAAAAVVQALRHAGVPTKPSSIHVQREPLHPRGVRAEAFADGSRFPPRALWHVEMRFPTAIPGPLVLGDGRFCGLGLMEPVTDYRDVLSFSITPERRVARRDGAALIQSLRRALMALARDDDGHVDRLFSGHETDGRPDRAHHHDHVFLTADDGGVHGEWITRLVVAAPWAADRTTSPRATRQQQFDEVVHRLEDLRAGTLGRFHLRAVPLEDGDPVIGPAMIWECKTAYLATRNLKKKDDPTTVVTEDVLLECRRRDLPGPVKVEVLKVAAGPRGGRLNAMLKLYFAAAVRGPLLLGRDSHTGGGLFHARSSARYRSPE